MRPPKHRDPNRSDRESANAPPGTTTIGAASPVAAGNEAPWESQAETLADSTPVTPIRTNPAELEADRKRATQRVKRYKNIQFFKKAISTAAAVVGVGTATVHSAQPSANMDGSFNAAKHPDRGAIKNSIETTGSHSIPMEIRIEDLERLTNLTVDKKDRPKFQALRIPTPTTNGLQEGQMVTTKGFIHLVADENDGDYHLQVNEHSTNAPGDLSGCLVVEVPHPNATTDPQLSAAFARVRSFIRDNCFGGEKPKHTVDKPLHVQITGQLFYDLHHSSAQDPGGGRGKEVDDNPMPATTIWEIHPITDIQLVP